MSIFRRWALALSLALTPALQAQPVAAQDVRVAARLGGSLSTFGGPNRMDSWELGMAAGLFVDARIAGPLRVESGVSWVRKGASGSSQGFEGLVPERVRLDYVQIPLALRLQIVPRSALEPSIVFGPAISFEVACSHYHDGATTAGDCDPDRARHDWSALLGASLRVPLHTGALVFEGRYDHGFRDLYALPRTMHLNRTLSLSTGFSLPVPLTRSGGYR